MHDIREIYRQAANPLSKKALAKLSRFHFLSPRKNRIRLLFFQKFIYWCFKARNRLEIRGYEHVQREKMKGGPFIVVANHAGNMDVMMHQAIHAHHDTLVSSFINGEGFSSPQVPALSAVLYFAEAIPRRGLGQSSVDRVVKRLVAGDRVMYFPEGSFDFGLVMDGFTGIARIAHGYWQKTGKLLRIIPSCSIGMHDAYNPHMHHHRFRHRNHRHPHPARYRLPKWAAAKRPGQKVIVNYGPAFTIDLPATPSVQELRDATTRIMQTIAGLWGQKRIRPNHAHNFINTRLPIVDGKRVYGG